MPQRFSGRSYPLRSRAASSVASFDASPVAACTALSVSPSYYSPLVTASTDRQNQAGEDAEEEEERAVVGGGDGGVLVGSTTSDVRVGLRVHNGHVAVGPVRRSLSDGVTTTTTVTTGTTTHATLPRYVTNAVVTEVVCTLDTCNHCCKCHLRHNKTGYGRCMRTARQPWSDCECAGKCEAGLCAQVECAGSHIVVDLTRSQSTTYHDDHHSSTVPVVSHPSAPSPPPTGVRREAGGVHMDEEVRVGPQADMHVVAWSVILICRPVSSCPLLCSVQWKERTSMTLTAGVLQFCWSKRQVDWWNSPIDLEQ